MHAWPAIEEIVAQVEGFMSPADAADAAGARLPLFLMTDANSTEVQALIRGLEVDFSM
jgi:hypothetical protein